MAAILFPAFSVFSPAKFLASTPCTHTNESKKAKKPFEVILLKLRMILTFNDRTNHSCGLSRYYLTNLLPSSDAKYVKLDDRSSDLISDYKPAPLPFTFSSSNIMFVHFTSTTCVPFYIVFNQ